jgi:hypothetical protein
MLRVLSCLSPHQPTVDRNHRTGHIVGQVGRQELDHLGAILDRPEPPKGDQLGSITIAPTAVTVWLIRPVAITLGAMEWR